MGKRCVISNGFLRVFLFLTLQLICCNIRINKQRKNGEVDKIKYKCWQKKIYEVYFFKHNRIFYIIADKNNIYLLHACRKQKNKTEKKDSKIVIKRAKELEKILGKIFI